MAAAIIKVILNHVEEIETIGSLFQWLAQLIEKINVYKQEISQIKSTESFIGRSYLR